jgi:outer membrane receptor protein involved in Fe transport
VLAGLISVTLAAATAAWAQSGGSIAGRVLTADTRQPIEGAQVFVEAAQRRGVTDATGAFRLRGLGPGWHRVRARSVGFRPALRDSVLVRAGETAMLELLLVPTEGRVDTLQAIDVTSAPDIVLDPLVPSMTQRITSEDLRQLPVSTLDEAIQLSAGVVGGSFRGGRAGQEVFVLDGLTLKNQLDASTDQLGLRFPPDLLTEAAVVTNGFSARYGQVLSGLVNAVTRDGGDRWRGRVAYETDRPAPDAHDYGLDRFVVAGNGPLTGPLRVAFAADLSGRLDADPVNAPAPADPADQRSQRPNLLPHNAGEQLNAAVKLTWPVGGGHTLRLLGLGSVDQRQLYDPAQKYDLDWAPVRRVTGSLLSGHWQFATPSRAGRSFVGDFRLAYFRREFVRGLQDGATDPALGALTFRRLRVLGEDIARARDTVTAAAPLAGYVVPDFSERTPWGVPAFFLGPGGRGELAWNRFGELRAQLDLDIGGRDADLFVGGELVRQDVATFQRVEAYRPVGGDVRTTTSAFTPITGAAYSEAQLRWSDLAFTAGLRYDRFDPRAGNGAAQIRTRSALSPRLAVSTVLSGATVVVSYGRFAQAPDFQYLVDAAFDDTTRTGRFRAGNPNLGYETATQFELSLRMRPRSDLAVRLNAFRRRLDGLVASVPLGLDPDSSIFGNADYGTVVGIEALVEREFARGWGARVLYALQKAEASASDAFRLYRLLRIGPTGDTIIPASVEFPLDFDRRHGLTVIAYGRVPERWGPRVAGIAPLAGFEGSAVVRYNSGLPYTRTTANGDSLLGLPNAWRLPAASRVDLLVRRPVSLRGLRGSLYLDVRNVAGTRTIVAVRRDTGTPGLGASGLQVEADRALLAHPEAIPYESQRYRRWADADGNGLIEGAELAPLYLAAARDYYQPLFAYGPPRLVRLGLEVIF